MKTVCEMLHGLFKSPESMLLIYDRVYAVSALKSGNTSTYFTRRSNSFLVKNTHIYSRAPSDKSTGMSVRINFVRAYLFLQMNRSSF